MVVIICITAILEDECEVAWVLLLCFKCYDVIVVGEAQKLGKVLYAESEGHDSVAAVLRESALFQRE